MWTEEKVGRYLPEKLCGWALDALNYLPHKFWKSDQKYRAWTLQETLYYFDMRLSNKPQFYNDEYERYLIEKEVYEKVALQDEIDKPVFQCDAVDREELQRQERTPKSDKKKIIPVKTDIILKSVMNKRTANISLTKRCSAIKALGFIVKAVLEEKSNFIDGRQRSTSKRSDSLSGVATFADSNFIGGSQKFDFDRVMKEQIKAMTKTEAEEFNELMNRRIAGWDIGKNIKSAELRSDTLVEIAKNELEDDTTFSGDGFSDDDSFFDSDNEIEFHYVDDNVFIPNIFNYESFDPTNKTNSHWNKCSLKG